MSKPTNKGPFRIPNKEQYHEILEILLVNGLFGNCAPDSVVDKFAINYREWIDDTKTGGIMDTWQKEINFRKRFTGVIGDDVDV